ncbi:VOC family protein [Galbibacter sp. EGI 63066]|uniref:VOC family protein n=1 Tax=Galbibacter sp. EGI 63066 TaxID=2993559 RepID=UPI002248AD7C|nr:VOC family protein [Galbibacter sp. EGI 63066]MCX2678702.1 VOC family protein [Galbibacter sp. EGI 63066]
MDTFKTTQKITPFLWFDDRAEEAVNFYVSIFPNSSITQLKKWPEKTPFPPESTKPDTVQQAVFTLDGLQFCAFDAGPLFKFNPSISFFAVFETDAEVDTVWNRLIDGGQALMPLDSYDWSERYGWVTDRFGVSWQLMKGKLEDVGQRICPLVMYSGQQRGNAEEAMNHYMSIFRNSSSDGIAKYNAGDPAPEGMVKHAQCRLTGQTFMLMDNGTEKDMPFSEAISFYVNCKDQKEVDYFWDKFTEEGSESVCGWLKDKFGVSWQIVPEFLTEKLALDEPEKWQKLFEAINRMKKLNVDELKAAYDK